MSGPATHDDIVRLAYDLWIERGRPLGSPELDWQRAERLLNLDLPAADQLRSLQDAPRAEPVQLAHPPAKAIVTGKSSRAVKNTPHLRARKAAGTIRAETTP